jgi:transposase
VSDHGGAVEPHDDEPYLAPAWAGAQKKSLRATEQDPEARAAWQAEIATWDAGEVVFLDETSTHTSFTRTYGRAPRGERVVGQVPRNHGPNISCLAALSPTGICSALAIPGPVDGEVFQTWLQTALLPGLAPGTTIVLDNLSVHRSANVRTLVADAGCTLRYLPAYSPDFNPIELTFARLKAYLRTVAGRSFDAVVTAIGESFSTVTTHQAVAWYRHCGYLIPANEASQPL